MNRLERSRTMISDYKSQSERGSDEIWKCVRRVEKDVKAMEEAIELLQ